MNSLLDAHSLDLPGRLGDRIRQRYADYYARQVAEQALQQARQHEWHSIGLSALVGGDPFEGEALVSRIGSALKELNGISVSLRSLSVTASRSLIKGEYDDLPDADRTRLDEYNDDALLIGRIDEEIATFAFDVARRRTQVLQLAENIGPIQGRPDFSIWDKLVSKRKTNSDLRVHVWTEEARYRIGDEVEICVRANRDCYVTLVDLQTSGMMYLLLPNRYQRDNRLLADRTYRIGGRTAPFAIEVTGPAGVEGVKAVATLQPLNVGEDQSGSDFVIFDRPQSQEAFASALVAQIEKLDPSTWDVGEWTFPIVE